MFPIATSLAAVSALEVLRGGARRGVPLPPPASTKKAIAAPAVPAVPAAAVDLNKLYQHFLQWNEVLRFFISGNVGNVIFFVLERMVYAMLLRNLESLPIMMVEYKDSVSFFLAYAVQILTQHWLHAFLVYGMHTISTREKYTKTLIACYTTYGSSAIGSTVLQTIFIKNGMNRSIAFCLNLWSFAILNFFVLKYINNRIVEAVGVGDKSSSKRNIKRKSNKGTSTKRTVKAIRGGAATYVNVHDFVLSVGGEPVELPNEY